MYTKFPFTAFMVMACLLNPTVATAWDGDEAQSAEAQDRDTLPTIVVGPPKSTEYPEPICSKCRVIVETNDETNEDSATLSLRYDDDLVVSLDGNIDLTLLLLDDTRPTVQISNVPLTQGTEFIYEIASEPGWSWSDVAYIWVRVTPST